MVSANLCYSELGRVWPDSIANEKSMFDQHFGSMPHYISMSPTSGKEHDRGEAAANRPSTPFPLFSSGFTLFHSLIIHLGLLIVHALYFLWSCSLVIGF